MCTGLCNAPKEVKSIVLRLSEKSLTLGLLAVSKPIGMVTGGQLHGSCYRSDAIGAVSTGL